MSAEIAILSDNPIFTNPLAVRLCAGCTSFGAGRDGDFGIMVICAIFAQYIAPDDRLKSC